jgi:hypothetical protein
VLHNWSNNYYNNNNTTTTTNNNNINNNNNNKLSEFLSELFATIALIEKKIDK